jgi:hypothetical protein
MNGNGTSRRVRLLTAIVAGAGLAATACGSGGSATISAPPASRHTAAEQAATLNWLAKTNQMWTKDNFSALSQVTTAEMGTVYQAEEHQAATAKTSSRRAFQLTGLSITVPCHRGGASVFVAYGDTDVFTLGQGMQPQALVFERAGGRWKLAAAVNRPGSSGWPALCRQGTPAAASAVLTPGSYAPDLARVLTHAQTGARATTTAAAPFALNGFLSGSGSITAQAATQIRKDRSGGVAFSGRFTQVPDPTFALPLANGRGDWLIGFLTQSDNYRSPSGVRKADWPDGNPVAKPRPGIVHDETETFITTYAAIDPLRSAGRTVTLDGFFGWPLTAHAS